MMSTPQGRPLNPNAKAFVPATGCNNSVDPTGEISPSPVNGTVGRKRGTLQAKRREDCLAEVHGLMAEARVGVPLDFSAILVCCGLLVQHSVFKVFRSRD